MSSPDDAPNIPSGVPSGCTRQVIGVVEVGAPRLQQGVEQILALVLHDQRHTGEVRRLLGATSTSSP
ncbi:MAG: hypothetical protein M9927_21210 [Anaerolineae bacterium]|nr:hypothetical protein [Anaerolineae bacterium]